MKKGRKQNLQIFILFILILFLIDKTNFPRALYDIVKLKYDKRMLKRHDFCEKTGYGYITFLKKEFGIEKINPLIVNYRSSPPKYWLYANTSKKYNEDHVILLNYKPIQTQSFKKVEDKFKSNEVYFGLNFLKKIEFIFDNNHKLSDLKGKLVFFNEFNGELVTILNLNFDDYEKDKNQIILKIKDKKLERIRKNSLKNNPGELVLKVELNNSSAMDNLSELTLEFNRDVEFLNYKILNNIDKCYFVKKND